MSLRRDASERFWSKVDKSGECWTWTGAFGPGHYGNFHFDGRSRLSHRVAWILTHGPIPDGLHVCHRCDNPPCVRPDHLFLGTAADNLRDAAAKGRMHPGERHGMSKLTAAAVSDIRSRLAAGQRGSDIAELHGVHRNTVYHVKKGRTWQSV